MAQAPSAVAQVFRRQSDSWEPMFETGEQAIEVLTSVAVTANVVQLVGLSNRAFRLIRAESW